MKTTTTIMRYASALLASALLAAAAEVGQAPGSPAARIEKLPQLIREAQKGVFFLRVLDENKRIITSGTGFLVDDKGALITSLHVIRPPSSQQPAAVEAIDASGKTFKVKGVTSDDESLDLALLELEEVPAEAVPVALAGDEPPEQGAYVLVVGHPQGLRFVCTDGIVSAVNKTRELPAMFRECGYVQAGPDVLWLQTSASVSMGNSGGPMLDAGGRAIGVMQWMARGAGMNFALHISAVKGFLAKPPVKAISVADFAQPEIDLQQLQRKFQADYQAFFNSQFAARRWSGNPPGGALAPAVEHPAKKHLPAMVELAAANRGRGVELRALSTVMMVACGRGCPAEVLLFLTIATGLALLLGSTHTLSEPVPESPSHATAESAPSAPEPPLKPDITALLAQLQSDDLETRYDAMRQLGTSNDPRLPDACLSVLNKEGHSIRRLAARAIGSLWHQIPKERIPVFTAALNAQLKSEHDGLKNMARRGIALLNRNYDSAMVSRSSNKRWVIYERHGLPCLIDTGNETEELLGFGTEAKFMPAFLSVEVAPAAVWHPEKEMVALGISEDRRHSTIWVWEHKKGLRQFQHEDALKALGIANESDRLGIYFISSIVGWKPEGLEFSVSFSVKRNGEYIYYDDRRILWNPDSSVFTSRVSPCPPAGRSLLPSGASNPSL